MPAVKRIQFSVEISAPAARVFQLFIEPESYRHWTSAFAEGSYFEGSWQQGQKIRFLVPSGEGMVAEIAENRPNEFISIRHLGSISNGVEDTTSESVRAWAPAYENYTFLVTPSGTKVVVDQDVTEEFEQYLATAWPKALQLLKVRCEASSAA